jgi:uncharacterized protein (TIGR03083 family)
VGHHDSTDQEAMSVDISEHVEQMRVETHRIVDRLAVAGFEAPVPSCPGWTLADLADHVGMAHRWAAAIMERRAQHRDDVSPLEARGEVPPPAEIGPWLVDGQRHLAEVIASTPTATDFWRFMRNAPSSVAFWARRQAHETAIHRVDAELAGTAVPPASVPLAFAADGVDELLLGFAPRYRPTGIAPALLHFRATDMQRGWTARIAEGVVEVTDRIDGPADLRVDAPINDLYLVLWNRVGTERATLTGDVAAFASWRAAVAV